jgi:integrase
MAELTVLAVRNAKARDKSYRLAAGKGLYLQVEPTGAKYWRLKYRYAGKQKMLGLGVFPEVSLLEARTATDEARRLLANGVDPSAQRKVQKLTQQLSVENSLKAVALEWIELKRREWAETYTAKVQLRLENDVFPWLGERPIKSITALELLGALKRIAERGTLETAHRIRRHLSQIFRYAIIDGRAERDWAADLQGALPMPMKRNFPTITDPDRIGELLRAIDAYTGTYITRAALKLAPMVFTRPGELRWAEWAEFDLKKGEWLVPGSRLKARKAHKAVAEDHVVPLSRQAVAILKELHGLTGAGRFVFPGERSAKRPMSENTINAAFARLGFKGEIVQHGLRHMASTALNEAGWAEDAIERQLAHKDKNAIRDIYNKAQYLKERREMMQAWADYLDKLRGEGGADAILDRKAA